MQYAEWNVYIVDFEQNVSIRALWGEIIISFIVYTRNVLWHCNNGKKKYPPVI